jgi:glc operon protein GlcG
MTTIDRHKLTYGRSLGLDRALAMVAAAREEAAKYGWPMCIAVVDPGGHLVALGRMDGAQTGGARIAEAKAATATGFKRPTMLFEEGLKSSVRYLGLSGALPLGGGIPIVVDGEIVGGIGVSGGTPQEDHQVAQVGIDALAG